MVNLSAFSKILDLLLPPRCAACQEIVLESKTLCQSCWNKANFISAPYCVCCGLPFEIEVTDGSLCLNCSHNPPPFVKARTVFPYDDFSKGMILSFKHGDRCDLAPIFAKMMVRSGGELLSSCDIIMPIPLHWRRLGMRRYNQAALLAEEISKITKVPTCPNSLKRKRNTQAQGHLSRTARQLNLQGAFVVTKDVQGKSILLIDDVLTTGATLINACNTLLKAGAKQVTCLTIARVLHNKTL
jgi:ComF family protein